MGVKAADNNHNKTTSSFIVQDHLEIKWVKVVYKLYLNDKNY